MTVRVRRFPGLRRGGARGRIRGVSGNEFAPERRLSSRRQPEGDPYLVYRDAHERQCVLSLSDTWERITIGRGMSADVALTWDQDVSACTPSWCGSPTTGR